MTHTNFEGWQEWTRPKVHDDELINWTAWQKDGHRTVLFDSANDFLDCYEHNATNCYWQLPLTKDKYRKEWQYGKDYPDFISTWSALKDGKILDKYLIKVDAAKEKLFNEYTQLSDLNAIAMSKRRRRKYSDDGNELDIDRYMCGDPSMWTSCPPSDIRKRTAKIYIDVWGSCGTNFRTFVDNIVFACALADIIEAAEISLEILVGTTADYIWYGTNHCTVAFPVKQANEPLDISRLLTFGISGFLRAICFNAYHGIDPDNWNRSCGTLLKKSFEQIKSLEPLNCDLLFRGGDSWTDPNNVDVIINKVKQVFNLTDTPVF